MKKEAVRTVSTIPVAPTTLYYAWLNPEQHAAMTSGGVAKIDGQVGSKYSSHGGQISGKLMIADLGRRLVVSWRNAEFPREAPDSRVEIHLEALGASTRVTVLHTDIPEGLGEKVKSFWNDGYFDPMRRYFSKYLPDPRLPPPPRPPMPPMDDGDDEDDETPKKLSKLAAYRKAREKGPSVVKAPPSKAVVATPTPAAKPEKAAKPAKPEKAPPPAKPAKPEKAPPPAKAAAKPAPKPAAKPAAKPALKPAAKKAAPKKPAPKKPAPKKPAPKKPAPKKPAPKKKKK